MSMRAARWLGGLAIFLLGTGAGAGCSGPASQGPAPAHSAPAPSFAAFDTNSDHKIDRQEQERLASILLRRSDADRNGRLGADEVKAILGDGARLEVMDANRDGRIDAAEFPKLANELYRRVDADGDLALDQQEYRSLMDLTAPAPPPLREPTRDAIDDRPGRGGIGSY